VEHGVRTRGFRTLSRVSTTGSEVVSRGKVTRLFHENAWALADQALISATNFATVVILARALAPRDFGAFVLAYAALLFVNGLQTAFVTQPHNILGQSRHGDEYRRYTLSTAAGQGLFMLAAAFAAIAVAVGAYLMHSSAVAVLFAVVPALLAWQAQEFARRVLYTEHRLLTAFAIDIVGYGGQIALILALVAADRASAAAALYAIAIASSVGALAGGWAIRHSLKGRVEAGFMRDNWAFGKWLGAAMAASWLSVQLFLYLTAIIVDASATAGLKASQTVLGPLNAFLLFVVTILPIRLAAARERNESIRAWLRFAYVASSPFVFVYCALVAVFARPILDALYGPEYVGYVDAVRLFAVFYVVMHAAYMLSSALSAKRLSRPLFTGNLWAAFVGVVVGWPLIARWEVNGAVVGMILSAIVLALAFWRSYRRSAAPAAQPSAAPVSDPLVYVVLISINRSRYPDTAECLESVAALDYRRHRAVVVDNGSTDDAAELFRKTFPDVDVIETGANLGFGAGSNVGIRHALEQGADGIWLLNNDAVAEPDALSALVETSLANPRAGIVGSVVRSFDDTTEMQAWGGGSYSTMLGIPTAATAPVAQGELSYISGASMYLSRAFIEDVGLFDESFFLYMEDVDLSQRALRRGWGLEVATGSVILHKGGRTINDGAGGRSAAADRLHAHGSGIFLGKHAGWSIAVSAPLRLTGMILRRLRRRQARSIPTVVGSFLSGLWTGLRGGAEPPLSSESGLEH
jgi:GT2 family glycosyltransferase/O-antigen/teichoic acid export membrane protein